jgi:hypothetical protein
MMAFKLIDALLHSLVPRLARGQPITNGKLDRVTECQARIADRLETIAKQTERLAEATVRHQTQLEIYLKQGCPSQHGIQRNVDRLEVQVERLRSVLKKDRGD